MEHNTPSLKKVMLMMVLLIGPARGFPLTVERKTGGPGYSPVPKSPFDMVHYSDYLHHLKCPEVKIKHYSKSIKVQEIETGSIYLGHHAHYDHPPVHDHHHHDEHHDYSHRPVEHHDTKTVGPIPKAPRIPIPTRPPTLVPSILPARKVPPQQPASTSEVPPLEVSPSSTEDPSDTTEPLALGTPQRPRDRQPETGSAAGIGGGIRSGQPIDVRNGPKQTTITDADGLSVTVTLNRQRRREDNMDEDNEDETVITKSSDETSSPMTSQQPATPTSTSAVSRRRRHAYGGHDGGEMEEKGKMGSHHRDPHGYYPHPYDIPHPYNFPHPHDFPHHHDFPHPHDYPQPHNYPHAHDFPHPHDFPHSHDFPYPHDFPHGCHNPHEKDEKHVDDKKMVAVGGGGDEKMAGEAPREEREPEQRPPPSQPETPAPVEERPADVSTTPPPFALIPPQDASNPSQDASNPTQDASNPTQDASNPTQDASDPTQDARSSPGVTFSTPEGAEQEQGLNERSSRPTRGVYGGSHHHERDDGPAHYDFFHPHDFHHPYDLSHPYDDDDDSHHDESHHSYNHDSHHPKDSDYHHSHEHDSHYPEKHDSHYPEGYDSHYPEKHESHDHHDHESPKNVQGTEDGIDHHEGDTTEHHEEHIKCTAPLSADWTHYNWYQILLENGGAPGSYLKGGLKSELVKVEDPCVRPVKPIHPGYKKDFTYKYVKVGKVFRLESVSLRLANTPHQFLDFEGQLIWAPPNVTDRYYHLTYRKDDTGLYARLLTDIRCDFKETQNRHTDGYDVRLGCVYHPEKVCDCDEHGREVCHKVSQNERDDRPNHHEEHDYHDDRDHHDSHHAVHDQEKHHDVRDHEKHTQEVHHDVPKALPPAKGCGSYAGRRC